MISKQIKLGDIIDGLICPNPKCRQAALKYVGKNPSQYPDRKKILECQHCFSRYHVDNDAHGLEWPGETEKKGRKEE